MRSWRGAASARATEREGGGTLGAIRRFSPPNEDFPLVLSDRSIREALESGRLIVDPLGDNALQPASLDIRLDRHFRVFRNHRQPYIDIREEMPELTEPEEIADAILFLCSPAAAMITGAIVPVDGGYLAR